MPSLPALHGAARLDDWGVIRAEGADAATFLHGQLTNDVTGLASTRARLAGFCSAKGRLQASFVVWRPAPETVFLACARDLLAPTLKRLSMFVLRAKCKLTDASAEMPLVGLAGDAADAAAAELDVWGVRADATGAAIRLPDALGSRRVLVAGQVEGTDAAPLALAHWRWLDLQSGIVTIEAATVDRFVPQMVNHELVGAVDFQKGCYPGQEVVARSQYRGTIKRRTLLFDSAQLPTPGQDVFAGGDASEPIGTVASAAPRPDGAGASALVEVRLASLDAGALHLGSAEGPRLEPRELPYALPLEAADA
ncbi:YgfZ/GcvT domain-containing protein [Piscinibacter koreensis]|uniref:Folate-binding protein YgfZ n=1 Tax=Piscinibacter koreensis TaxID=2742824 RepID=A0A7Y6NRJ5_9BURK|nr:folate-binding protein YgfZ [Schlegelella koreensis]NUZ08037.1 folate-binding protein YgfZ [Schlegelella koreensis]